MSRDTQQTDSPSGVTQQLLGLVPSVLRQNLLAKLLVLLLVGALLSGVVVVAIYSQVASGLDAQVESQVKSDTTVQAEVYQNWLTERWSTVEALAEEDEFTHSSERVVHQWLVAVEPGVTDDFDAIYVADQASGDVIASEDSVAPDLNLYDSGLDKQLTERRIFISQDAVEFGDGERTLVGVREGDRLFVGSVPVGTSLITAQAFDGAETTLRSLDGHRLIGETTTETIDLQSPDETGTETVVTTDENDIVGTRILAHDDLTLQPVDAYDESTTIGTVVVTKVPKDEAFAIQNQISDDIVIAFGLTFLLLIGTAAVSMRSVTTSVNRLSERARRISDGNFDIDMESSRTDELGVLYDSVREMRDSLQERLEQVEQRETELEESNEKLERFAYVASHDLQEPLRMVSSYMDLLEMELEDELDEETREYMEFAVDGSERMQAMIDGLLAYSRVQTRASPFEEVDVDELVAVTLQDLRLKTDESGASVDVDDLPTVLADENQLGQVFQNLVKNAIEHGGEDTHVEITATDRDDATEFAVSDDGPGIPENRHEDIFGIFDKGGDSDGTGIGLAVVKEIIERHGGDIWVESTLDEGTTFHFTIPDDPGS
jgi:signal transduction histidine kinase